MKLDHTDESETVMVFLYGEVILTVLNPISGYCKGEKIRIDCRIHEVEKIIHDPANLVTEVYVSNAG